MENIDKNKELFEMSEEQTVGLLEAIKIIAEKADTTEEIVEAIKRIQCEIKKAASELV